MLELMFFFLFSFRDVYANSTIKIKSDTIKSDKRTSNVEAKGSVEFTKGIYKITTEEVNYDKQSNKIYLKSKVKMTDSLDNKIFAESGEIDDDMQKGVFNDAGIILNNGTSILSPKIEKEENNIFKTKKANYCFCKDEKLNIDLPYDEIRKETQKANKQVFTVYSSSSIIDRENKKVHFNHAFVKLFGIPIFYLPYIATSAGFREKISGFTPPEIFSYSNYGLGFSIGYNFYFGDNLRYLVKPIFFQKKNILLDNNFYYYTKNTNLSLETSFIFDDGASKNIKNINGITEENEGIYRENRYYFSMLFNRKVDGNLFFMSNINILSDRYVIRDYRRSFSNFANSSLLISKSLETNSFLNWNILNIQQIQERTNKDMLNNPNIVSKLNYHKSFFLYSNEENTSLELKSYYEFVNLFDVERDKYDKLAFSYSLQYNKVLDGVSFFEVDINLFGDLYKNIFDKNRQFVSQEGRVIPEISIKYEKPIYFASFSFKPIIEYYYSTNFNRNINYYDDDSKESHLSVNNIFSNNRYSGNDLREFGNRVNYGLNFSYYKESSFLLNATVAQGYRDDIDRNNIIKNFENNLSDILTSLNIKMENIYFDYLNILDNTNYKIKQNEFIFSFKSENFTFSSGYSFEKVLDTNGIISNKEQLNFETLFSITNKLKLKLHTNYDLEGKRTIYIENGLIFEENCLRVQSSLKKYNYIDYGNNNHWSFNFSFRIINN